MTNQQEQSFDRFNRVMVMVIVIFGVLMGAIFTINYYSGYVNKAVKGYVQGALVWSAAQKKASYHLKSYLYSKKTSDYKQYTQSLNIVKGDRQAALTLISDNPNYEKARQGFIEGNIPVEYIDPMIWIVSNFKDYERFVQAIEYWKQADQNIHELNRVAEELHTKIGQNELSAEEQSRYSSRIDELNNLLTNNVQGYVGEMRKTEQWVNSAVFWGNGGLIILLVLFAAAMVVGLIRKTKKWDQTLSKNKAMLDSVLKNTQDVIYLLDIESGDYSYVSPSVKEVLGYSDGYIKEKGKAFIRECIHPTDLKHLEQEIKQMNGEIITEQLSGEIEFRMVKADGDYLWVSSQWSLVTNGGGEPEAVVGSIRDISQRKLHEIQNEKALKEKQVLLTEIHHRVKNNLAIISGLLMLEAMNWDEDSEVHKVMMKSKLRIHSIAKIHEKLYQSNNFSNIDLKNYISDLIDIISEAVQGSTKHVNIKTECDNITLNINQAIPCALIVNELVTNAFKYAFKTGTKNPALEVMFNINGSSVVTITIKDNGIGLSDDFEAMANNSLGLQLVNTLVKQLDGTIMVESDERSGTCYQIKFEKREKSGSAANIF